jgi:hypothetical protein
MKNLGQKYWLGGFVGIKKTDHPENLDYNEIISKIAPQK